MSIDFYNSLTNCKVFEPRVEQLIAEGWSKKELFLAQARGHPKKRCKITLSDDLRMTVWFNGFAYVRHKLHENALSEGFKRAFRLDFLGEILIEKIKNAAFPAFSFVSQRGLMLHDFYFTSPHALLSVYQSRQLTPLSKLNFPSEFTKIRFLFHLTCALEAIHLSGYFHGKIQAAQVFIKPSGAPILCGTGSCQAGASEAQKQQDLEQLKALFISQLEPQDPLLNLIYNCLTLQEMRSLLNQEGLKLRLVHYRTPEESLPSPENEASWQDLHKNFMLMAKNHPKGKVVQKPLKFYAFGALMKGAFIQNHGSPKQIWKGVFYHPFMPRTDVVIIRYKPTNSQEEVLMNYTLAKYMQMQNRPGTTDFVHSTVGRSKKTGRPQLNIILQQSICNLEEALKDPKFTLRMKLQALEGAARGLQSFEAENLVFTDFKPANILVDYVDWENASGKLCDLESCYTEGTVPLNFTSSILYSSPEGLSYLFGDHTTCITRKHPLWGLGILLYEITQSISLSADPTPVTLPLHSLNVIKTSVTRPYLTFAIATEVKILIASWIHTLNQATSQLPRGRINDLIRGLLLPNPFCRPSIEEVIQKLGEEIRELEFSI